MYTDYITELSSEISAAQAVLQKEWDFSGAPPSLAQLPYSYRRMVLTLIQGFSVEGQENIQEILSKQLYLCQFLVAISILRPGKAQIRFVYKWTYLKSTKQE